ncbi:MAG: RNA polymerase sigma factor [Candidatus Ryanbacteria bacterium]|nr:RNA polymerase sigma factor [Candidatus Ryanbacteria bacterium]
MNTANRKDEEVLWASLSEPALFRVLVEKYQSPFLRLAYGVVRSREEAEDIVQEAFCDIYRNALKFKRQEGASFKSWAYRVVLNKAISHYRKLKRERERTTLLEPAHYENLGVEEGLSEPLDKQITVERFLNLLPEDLRRVVSAYYIEDKPYAAIAKEENISLSTLKMRLFRAKRMLREQA